MPEMICLVCSVEETWLNPWGADPLNSSMCCVGLIWFLWSIWFIWLVSFNQINETDQTNQTNERNQRLLPIHKIRFTRHGFEREARTWLRGLFQC